METKKCKTCNRELPHHIYGYGNNTEQQFNEWNNKEVI